MCEHNRVTFVGLYSLVGNYVCDDCEAIIDPVEHAKAKGDLNVALISYYEENPEKLKPMWRDHPTVRHIYG